MHQKKVITHNSFKFDLLSTVYDSNSNCIYYWQFLLFKCHQDGKIIPTLFIQLFVYFFSVTSSGTTLTLPDLGVSLTIPEGALDKGFTEEVFLAVMTEGRDRPRLSDNQTLLSPVVLTGPPRLTFKKPVVLTFGHCAMAQNSWEMGVYHCDSLFSGKKV